MEYEMNTRMSDHNGMRKLSGQWLAVLVAVLMVMISASSFGQAKEKKDQVYRWVDEEGNVHYSATLPPDFKDRKADVLDKQGITREKDISLVPPPPRKKGEEVKGELPRDASGMKRPEPLYSDAELQRQQDALLLLRYDSDQEILDAMQVEINQLAYDERLLTTSRTSLQEAYRGNVREAAERQRAGLPVEESLAREVKVLKSRLVENGDSIARLDEREAYIRREFETNLQRYRKLVADFEAENS